MFTFTRQRKLIDVLFNKDELGMNNSNMRVSKKCCHYTET